MNKLLLTRIACALVTLGACGWLTIAYAHPIASVRIHENFINFTPLQPSPLPNDALIYEDSRAFLRVEELYLSTFFPAHRAGAFRQARIELVFDPGDQLELFFAPKAAAANNASSYPLISALDNEKPERITINGRTFVRFVHTFDMREIFQDHDKVTFLIQAPGLSTAGGRVELHSLDIKLQP